MLAAVVRGLPVIAPWTVGMPGKGGARPWGCVIHHGLMPSFGVASCSVASAGDGGQSSPLISRSRTKSPPALELSR